MYKNERLSNISCSPIKRDLSMNVNESAASQIQDIVSRLSPSFTEEIIQIKNYQASFKIGKFPDFLGSVEGLIIEEASEEIIPLDVKLNESHASSTPVRISKISASSPIDLDVTGSPLETPFLFKRKEIEEHHAIKKIVVLPSSKKISEKGLPIHIARFIINSLRKFLSDIPVAVVCDALDPQKAILLGIHSKEKGFRTQIVTVGGPHSGVESLPSIDHISSHLRCTTSLIESSADAVFEVLNGDQNGSSVVIKSTWKRPMSVLCSPSLNAKTTAEVHIENGDPRSHALNLFVELKRLKKLIEGITESGEIVWYTSAGEDSMLEQLETFLENKATKSIRNEDFVDSFDNLIEEKFFQVRQNMEFTDHLWSILQMSESYSDLKQGLNRTFHDIANGFVRPQIHIRNTTQVAKTCQALMLNGESSLPDLEGLKPLQMLIEIGLEKIKRDYVTIFQVGELVTNEQLSPFITWLASNGAYKECYGMLSKLHTGVQLVVVLRRFLKLPSAVLSQCVKEALVILKDSFNCSFKFNLQTSLISSIINGLSPLSWSLHLTTDAKHLTFRIQRDAFLHSDDVIESEEVKYSTLVVQSSSHWC